MAHQLDRRRRRIALYSHDTQGLGHIRRNLAVAGALAATDPAPEILLVTGAPSAATLAPPAGGDFLSLPALGKELDGTYRARSMAAPLGALIELRSRILVAALTTFDPDLLIVDKVPRGVAGELESALAALREHGRTRCVLGLRDVLDEVGPTRREWYGDRSGEAVARYYDAVWIYGDPAIFDPLAEYGLSGVVRQRATFTGYLGHGRPPVIPKSRRATTPPYHLCLVGGGQDGLDLARHFVEARLPEGHRGVVLAGPYMDAGDRRILDSATARRPAMSVLGFVADAEQVIAGAASVVSMGGYNAVCEILAHDVPALIVPRIRPRAEQLVRARRLAEHGLVDVVHPDELTTAALSGWLGSAHPVRTHPDEGIDLHGLARIPALAEAVLAQAVPDPAPLVRAPARPATAHSVREVVDVAV